jgi:hypothetical protein
MSSNLARPRIVAGTDVEQRPKPEIQLSDFELVPRRKRRGKVASARQFANMDLTRWKMDHPPGCPGPSKQTMENLGRASRFAAAFLEMEKKDLVDLFVGCEHEMLDVAASLLEAAERMKDQAHALEVAHMRLVVAASVHSLNIGAETDKGGAA